MHLHQRRELLRSIHDPVGRIYQHVQTSPTPLVKSVARLFESAQTFLAIITEPLAAICKQDFTCCSTHGAYMKQHAFSCRDRGQEPGDDGQEICAFQQMGTTLAANKACYLGRCRCMHVLVCRANGIEDRVKEPPMGAPLAVVFVASPSVPKWTAPCAGFWWWPRQPSEPPGKSFPSARWNRPGAVRAPQPASLVLVRGAGSDCGAVSESVLRGRAPAFLFVPDLCFGMGDRARDQSTLSCVCCTLQINALNS